MSSSVTTPPRRHALEGRRLDDAVAQRQRTEPGGSERRWSRHDDPPGAALAPLRQIVTISPRTASAADLEKVGFPAFGGTSRRASPGKVPVLIHARRGNLCGDSCSHSHPSSRSSVAAPAASASENQQAAQHGETEYVVVYREGATDAARAAIAATGGQIVKENAEVGVATVRSSDASFAANISTRNGVEGVAENTIIGSVPAAGTRTSRRPRRGREGRPRRADARTRRTPTPSSVDPIPATDRRQSRSPISSGTCSRSTQPPTARTASSGSKRVLVGIIDTGVDGTHPDIAPNFSTSSAATSRPTSPRMRTATRSTDRVRFRRASTRRTWTTTDTARTSRRRSVRRSTASASPVSHRT